MTNQGKSNRKTRLLVLDGHPGKSTLSQALAEAVRDGASATGKDVRLLRLSQMVFDPNLAEGYRGLGEGSGGEQPLEADLAVAQEAISWCDELVIVHPLWWGSAPAKLKGFFDRVLLPGFAFRHVKGKDFPEKLLAGKTATVLITSDTPGWYLKWVYGNGWVRTLRKQILQYCGFGKVRVRLVGPVHGSSSAARELMISKARKLAA